MNKCVDCKWALLDYQERLTIKLQNKSRIFECMFHPTSETRPCAEYEYLLIQKNPCSRFEPCPESQTPC